MLNFYRPDINGLRAVAVISVILYHANVPGFTGGFVGVDIFFVISGFLISSIILREMTVDSFSVIDFYERRIRRILPALLVVLFVATALAWLILLPDDFRQFSKSLIASILMIPNIAASLGTVGDYFAPSADTIPLLHLWSLGLEEQFYLLFPIPFVFFVRKFSSYICWVILITITSLSLALAFWATLHRAGFGFYWLPPRAWEFLLGIGIAYYEKNYKHRLQIWSEFLAFIGSLFIVLAVSTSKGATIGSSLPYQSLACFGSAAIIASGRNRQTLIYKILAFKPVVGIGLISYSLYLWHWPLLSLFSYWEAGLKINEEKYVVCVLLIFSLILSILTWKYVEQPFCNKQFWKIGCLIKTVLTVKTLLIVFGIIIWQTQWIPQGFDAH